MNFREKAFTLIELLVVVAIIGILAAVGVVAYNGYTASAKIASVKSNHSSIVKFLSSELKKCEIQGGSIQLKSKGGSQTLNNVNCSKSSTDTASFFRAVQDHLNNEGFKNPYITSNPAFYSSGSATNGRTVGSFSGSEITITSAFTNSNGNLETISGKVIDDR